MKKKMFGYILLFIILLVLFIVYSVVKVRFMPSAMSPKPDVAVSPDIDHLYTHVEYLSVRIGSRSVYEYGNLQAARNYIVSYLENLGCAPDLQDYEYNGKIFSNVIVTIKGKHLPEKTVVFGAHYDTVRGTPGADDNASAVAVLLEMCRALKDSSPGRTLKLIFFTLEEPPVFRSEFMGSFVWAKGAKAREEDIHGMVCLEMLGYYTERKGGQSFPLPLMGLLYSTTPNFIAVVGNLQSRNLVKRVGGFLASGCGVPVETLSTVGIVPGVDFSDHRSFWEMGYPAIMVTDTAFYRNPNYHTANDTIDTLDFSRMADLLRGLVHTARSLTDTP